jgi:hypothetical protein
MACKSPGKGLVAQGGVGGRNNSCRGVRGSMEKKKKLAMMVVIVTITNEHMGWWRRLGCFWSRRC